MIQIQSPTPNEFTAAGFLFTLLMGMIGGVANSLLVDEGFVAPKKITTPEKATLKIGFLGNIILGAVAAMATYFFGAYQLIAIRQLGIALISGLGGGNILTSLMQKQETAVLKTQMDALEKAVQKAMTLPGDLP